MSRIPKRSVIAIVGVTHEAAGLLPLLLRNDSVTVTCIINPLLEDLEYLTSLSDLDIIVDATNDPAVTSALKTLELPRGEILNVMSARLRFGSGKPGISAERTAVLENLQELGQAVRLSKNKEELFKLILTTTIRLTNADSGSIMLIDSRTHTMKIEIAQGLAPEIVTSTSQKITKGIAGKVVQSKKPLITNGPAQAKNGRFNYERNEVKSSICCPLLVGEDVVGVISVNSTTRTGRFTEEDLRFTNTIAAISADIIRTSKEWELSARSTIELFMVQNARKILNLPYTFDERLNLLLMRIVNALNAEICNYYWYNAEMKAFFVKASSSFKVATLSGKVLKLNDILARKVRAGRDTAIAELQDKNGLDHKWYIAQPIFVAGQLLGALFVHYTNNRHECLLERELICQVGDLLASEVGAFAEKEAFRIKSMKFSAISEATFDFAGGGSRFGLAKVVVANACLILEVESCILRLLNRHSGELEMIDSFSLRNATHLREIQVLDEIIARQAFGDHEAVMTNTLQSNPLYADKSFDARSALSTCLQRHGKRFGTLSIYNKRSLDFYGRHRFSENDKDIFLNFSLQVAKAFARFLE
jgi:putative methionine-R-sulfoxide reductase with GAF domain